MTSPTEASALVSHQQQYDGDHDDARAPLLSRNSSSSAVDLAVKPVADAASAPASVARLQLAVNAGVPLEDPDDPEPPEESLCCCYKWKAPLLLSVYSFFNALPGMMTQSLLIEVKKDYFGSDQKAALITSYFASAVAFANLFLIVTYGRLLDSYGRKPFFILNAIFGLASVALMAIFPRNPLPFMIVSTVGSLIQSSYQGAFIADLVAPEHRGYAFTIVSGFGALSMILALPVGIVQAPDVVFYLVGCAGAGVALLIAIFAIPESLPRAQRTTKMTVASLCNNPFKGTKIIFSSRALSMIAGISCIVVTGDVGTSDIYMFYMNQRVGFTPQLNAFFFVEMSILCLFAYFVLYRILQRYLSNVTILSIALTANATMMLVVATIWAKWAVFAVIAPLYGLLSLANPVLDTIIANIGRERDVGKRMTAMTAVSDFCNAVGPLIFGILYGYLPTSLSALPFFVACGLFMCAMLWGYFYLGKAIHKDQEDVQNELLAEAEAAAAAAGEGAADGAPLAITGAHNAESPDRAAAIGRTLYNDDDLQ